MKCLVNGEGKCGPQGPEEGIHGNYRVDDDVVRVDDDLVYRVEEANDEAG